MRGHVRLRQAALRLGAAVGTVLQTVAMVVLLDRTSLLDGLGAFSLGDLGLGALTGTCCILALFAAEVHTHKQKDDRRPTDARGRQYSAAAAVRDATERRSLTLDGFAPWWS